MMARGSVDLKRQLLLAAFECAGGDSAKTFTFEELLVAAWKQDKFSWGLRGFENDHPDSERIHRELDSRGGNSKGLVELGWLDKVRPRIYRLTLKGLAETSRAKPEHKILREKIRRESEDGVRRVLEHATFQQWLSDKTKPNRFRDAGAFWGVAPGTPPAVIRKRIQTVEDILVTALELLGEAGVEKLASGRGILLYDRTDVERCLEFQNVIKSRFAGDLKVLGVDIQTRDTTGSE